MKKKLLLSCMTAAMVVGLVPQTSTTVQANSNYQGSQFEQGAYDTKAEYPYGDNFSNNFPYVGTDINEIKWQFKIQKDGFGSRPAIGNDGTLYVTGKDYKFYALNKDGTLKWEKTGTYFYNTPSISEDGTIYVNANRELHAYNPEGGLKWKVNTWVSNSPSIDKDGTIYIYNDMEYRLEAYNSDGTQKWISKKMAGSDAKILISKDGLIHTLTFYSDNVTLYTHGKDGSELWRKTISKATGVHAGITLGKSGDIYYNQGDIIYIIGSDGTVKKEWRAEEKLRTAPVISEIDGTVYVGGTKHFYAYNPDGSIKWKYFIGNITFATPVVDKNNVVYFMSQGQGIKAVNSDGRLKWDNKIDNHSYDLSDDSNITIGKDGTLYTSGWGTAEDGNRYYAVTAIGGAQSETPCPRPDDYLDSIEAKLKTNDLTDAEKKEAIERLTKILNSLE
jgi:PQQ-like domain